MNFLIIIILIIGIIYYFLTYHYIKYSGNKKNITNKQKVLFYIPTTWMSLNGKHGNQTRIISMLKYFIDNKYDIVIVTIIRLSWNKEDIEYLNNIGITIYFLHNYDVMNIYNIEKPDIVFINYITSLRKNIINDMYKKSKVIVDFHDCPITNVKMYQVIRSNKVTEDTKFEEIDNIIDKLKTSIYDISGYNIDSIIHISYEEYEKYNKFTNIPQIYIPYYEKVKLDGNMKRENISFVASDNDFNIFAFKYFYKNTLPKIIKKMPTFKLKVYGVIVDKLKNKYKSPNIDYVGFVKNKSDIYNSSKFVICPLLFGTGAKIKVLEAIAYGVPVVSYRFSGTIELEDNINGLIVNNEDEFVDDIILLESDEDLRNRLSVGSLDYNKFNKLMDSIIQI
jgi:glycosyltransferase involved in cell wall biosynthesis